jgi:hypothetical protein
MSFEKNATQETGRAALEIRLLALVDKQSASDAEKQTAKTAIKTAIQNPVVARVFASFVGNG